MVNVQRIKLCISLFELLTTCITLLLTIYLVIHDGRSNAGSLTPRLKPFSDTINNIQNQIKAK